MKKLSLFFVTAISITATAQNYYVGLQGGVSWTNVNVTRFVDNTDARKGFSGGLNYGILLKKRFFVGTDILYTQRGFSNTFTLRGINPSAFNEQATIKMNYDYLSVPLKAGVMFGKKISGFINIGIIPAFLFDAKTITPIIDSNGKTIGTETADVTDRASKFDFAGMAEIGASFTVNKNLFFVSLTGQKSVTSTTNSEYFSNSKIQHNGLTLCVGIKHRLTN
jgi:hypothetical protein